MKEMNWTRYRSLTNKSVKLLEMYFMFALKNYKIILIKLNFTDG